MEQLGAGRRPTLLAHDILSEMPGGSGTWDSIVVSEVLEHLEEPRRALDHLVSALRPNGRIFVTTPVNTPMPDHIHLFQDPEEVLDLVTSTGLEILGHRLFTGVGVTEERARKRRMPIACAVIARSSGAGEGRG
jgi:SAM-dependent methyltransferase